MGVKQTCSMSAIPPKADMVHQGSDVRFVPCGQLLLYINR
jgi:hypothetical protein